MDIEITKKYQRDRFAEMSAQMEIPAVLSQALTQQLENWTPLCPGVWFESNSRTYFENERLVQFMTYDAYGDEIEDGDEFHLFAIWKRDSSALDRQPVMAFTFVYNDDDTVSHLGTSMVAEDIDKYFSMLASGAIGVGHECLLAEENKLQSLAPGFPSYDDAAAYSARLSERHCEATQEDESMSPAM
jgi:hypothetical protein